MKFSEYKYQRPDYEYEKKVFSDNMEKLKKAESFESFRKILDDINKQRNRIESMKTVASINYSINTGDKNNIAEKNYWDENAPKYDKLNVDLYKIIIDSKYDKEIIETYGMQFYNIIKCSISEISDEIITDLIEENRLCSEYTRLLAAGNVDFGGKKLNLSEVNKYTTDSNRNIRKSAAEAFSGYFEEHEEEFDILFDKLVKVRDRIAKKLGYENFVELGYKRMKRTDYNENDVSKLRKAVENSWDIIIDKINKNKSERLSIEKIKYYDDEVEFPGWNMEPEIEYDEMIKSAEKMYSELSDETGVFFRNLVENEMMDLKTAPRKGMGGYCTYVPDLKSPFVFANFNRSFDDVDTLTHEMGHGFQLYMSNWIDMPEINFPTLDSCEIHSMTMEFITMPWMELFFGKNASKYEYSHLCTISRLIPYCMVVDEFQHIIYRNINMTPNDRKKLWRNLEKKYIKHKDYDDNSFLDRGGWWLRQGHIFKNPFYYIDYALASLCAIQLAEKYKENHREGWNLYMDICKVGGTRSFNEIVNIANLDSPFEDKSISKIVRKISQSLDVKIANEK